MAIRPIATILCESLIRHQDGKVSLIGLFRNIEVNEFPFRKRFGLLVEFVGDVGDQYQVTLESNGLAEPVVIVEDVITQQQIPAGNRRWSAVALGEVGVEFDQPDTLRVVIRSGERIISEVAYGVSLHAQQDRSEENDQSNL